MEQKLKKHGFILMFLAFVPSLAIPVALPASAQILDGGVQLEKLNEMNLDRFGNPTYGLRAQREPELRRLRKQQGRDLFEGEVTIFDMSAEDLEALYEKLNK